MKQDFPILKYFTYKHLPEHLQLISKPFCILAADIAGREGDYDETCAALRCLLESKDCAVRAAV